MLTLFFETLSLLLQGAWLTVLVIMLFALVTIPLWGTAIVLAILIYF